MLPLDGSYLYQLGKALKELESLPEKPNWASLYISTWSSLREIRGLVQNSIYTGSLGLAFQPAKELMEHLEEIESHALDTNEASKEASFLHIYNLRKKLNEFEIAFALVFRQGQMFLATPKGAYELSALVSRGETLLPQDLGGKVPKAIFDIKQGARCLAFELFTASGFHFHRANESVVLKYLSVIAPNKQIKDSDRSLGRYINMIEEADGKKSIVSCLRDLKDMHRNPLMHAEAVIETADEAIALLNGVHTATVAMLREIPTPKEK